MHASIRVYLLSALANSHPRRELGSLALCNEWKTLHSHPHWPGRKSNPGLWRGRRERWTLHYFPSENFHSFIAGYIFLLVALSILLTIPWFPRSSGRELWLCSSFPHRRFLLAPLICCLLLVMSLLVTRGWSVTVRFARTHPNTLRGHSLKTLCATREPLESAVP